MPIKVRCPSCQKVLTAPDAARGKAVRCSGCQGVVKIPAEAATTKQPAQGGTAPGRTAPGAGKPAAKKQESTELLLSIKARDAVDHSANICPKCGADMDEEEIECPVCGIDITTGELGKTALKARRKTLDASDFLEKVWSDAKKFTGRNKNLVFQTIGVTLTTLALTIFLFVFYLWCYKLPPKYFVGSLMILAAVSAVGWPWYLALKVILATLDKKDRIKKVHNDFYSCIALGIKFFLWVIAFGFPTILIGGVLYLVLAPSGQAWVGLIVTACLAFINYLPFPIVMAHMAMPVQYPGWLIPKMFPLLFRMLKPTLYWWVVVITVNIPIIAGITATGIIYAPELNKIVTEIEEQNDKLREHFYLTQTKAGASAQTPDDVPWPSFFGMIVPTVVLTVSAIYWGFSCVFSVRALALFVFVLKKSMDLITESPELAYIPKSKTPTRKVRPVAHPALNGCLVFFGLSLYPVMGVIGGASRPSEDPTIPMIVGGLAGLSIQMATAGRWVVFQKFGVPGWASMVPVYNAFIILRMSGWETKYFAMMIFPWIRKSVMFDVADRWNRDRQTFGLGLTAFPFAYWPMLGWNHSLHSDCYIPKEWDPTGKPKAAPSDDE